MDTQDLAELTIAHEAVVKILKEEIALKDAMIAQLRLETIQQSMNVANLLAENATLKKEKWFPEPTEPSAEAKKEAKKEEGNNHAAR